MKRKFLSLAVALAVCMAPLTSCSKDEPTPMDVVKSNVANTEWIGADSHIGASTLTFKGDGTFVIDVANSSMSFARGTYTQNGLNIRFDVKNDWYFAYSFRTGVISYGGGTLEIPMYYYDNTYAYTAKFTLNVLK